MFEWMTALKSHAKQRGFEGLDVSFSEHSLEREVWDDIRHGDLRLKPNTEAERLAIIDLYSSVLRRSLPLGHPCRTEGQKLIKCLYLPKSVESAGNYEMAEEGQQQRICDPSKFKKCMDTLVMEHKIN
eukprot:Trichotokara_eunicae@DN2222_c0_g1_i2.p1